MSTKRTTTPRSKRPRRHPAQALHALVNRNYPRLREIAVRELRSRRMARTCSPTSLVAESVVRLMRQRNLPTGKEHLCGLATILMAQALSDRAKLRRATKRGGRSRTLTIDAELTADRRRDRRTSVEDHAAFPDATAAVLGHMAQLSAVHPRMMEVLALHTLLEMPMPRVAEVLRISQRTAYRELGEARRRLASRLGIKSTP
jgi:DNA-directed RNA polymerase specialized sigma24 family protein